MKSENCSLLKINETDSFVVPIDVYETVAEADAAGGAGATLAAANQNLLFRGAYDDARNLVEEATLYVTKVPITLVVEEYTVEENGKKVKKTRKVRDPKDTVKTYVKRAIDATKGSFPTIQTLVTALALGTKKFQTDEKTKAVSVVDVPKDQQVRLAVDIKKTPRTGSGLKLAEKWKTQAINFLDGVINPATNKPYQLKNFNKVAVAAGLTEFVPSGEREKDVLALGNLIKTWAEKQPIFAGM